MITYPNQRIVTVHKDKYYQDFLQVGKDEWMYAYSTLNRGAFGLYLYLCGNMNGYRFALSSVAVQNALDVSDSTYRRAVESLLEAGYLIMDGNKHVLHFYAKPQPTTYEGKKKKGGAAAPMDEPSIQPDEDNWGDEALSYLVSARNFIYCPSSLSSHDIKAPFPHWKSEHNVTTTPHSHC